MASGLMFPKAPPKEKKRDYKTYYNSTIRIKADAKPLKRNSTPIKCKQKTAKKLKGEYHSVFTSDMSRCIITGDKNPHPHHIFDGPNKALSEKYGFMIPLRGDWHTLADYGIHTNRELDLEWKRKCENYYIEKLNKTKEDWINEFGKWW